MINESVVQIAQLAEESREHVQKTEMAAQTVADCGARLGVLVGRFRI
jgi:methyl-accepting chemotaxis protein